MGGGHRRGMRDEIHDGLIESSAMRRRGSAFTLVELAMVLAVCALLVAGLAIRSAGDAGMQRRVACERVMRWVESARREAVVRRRPVLLGIRPLDGAGPGGPACKAAMFALDAWPPSVDRRVVGEGLSCWWMLDRGVIFDPGSDDGEVNPMCGDAIEVVDRSLDGRSVFVNAMVFDADGRLVHPEGTLSVTMRLVAARWDSTRGCWMPVDGSGDRQDCIRIGRHGGRAMVLQK